MGAAKHLVGGAAEHRTTQTGATVRRHGDRWGLAHDRTTIKLLFRWDILSREERDLALRELSEELHSKCQANPGMGKFRFY